MNMDDYSQYSLNQADLEGKIEFLSEGLEGIVALLIDDTILGVELPSSVALEILDTAAGVKSASVTSRTKTARLSTGVEIQVPEYLETGEMIKVNTETGKYMSRA